MKADDEKQIDIVIAWVDGDEPLLKQKRARYQKTTSAASDAISSTRFASNDEIYYNIASIIVSVYDRFYIRSRAIRRGIHVRAKTNNRNFFIRIGWNRCIYISMFIQMSIADT